MAEQFCGHCGVEIPTSEIASGASIGPAGEHHCSRHRGAAVATAVRGRGPGAGVLSGAGAGAAAAGLDSGRDSSVEEEQLLFCSNCLVSIPQYDVRSGRARREYGSMLCAPCAKADPGERAARRESVEAEMRADMEEDDPVVVAAPASRTRSVRHAPVGAGVSAAPVHTIERRGGSASSYLVVAGLFLLVGVGLANALIEPEVTEIPDLTTPRFQALEDRLLGIEERMDTAKLDADRQVADTNAEIRSLTKRVRSNQSELQLASDGALADFRAQISDASMDLSQRMAKSEGTVEQLAQQVNTLLTSTVNRAPEEVRDKSGGGSEGPSDPGGAVKPPVVKESTPPVAPPVAHPEVDRWVEELLNDDDSGTRFAAASRLGRSGDPRAIPSLARALVSDKNYLVKRACTTALKGLKAWNATPMLVKALEDKEASVAHAANAALLEITGKDFGVDWEQSLGERRRRARDARKWWEKNREKPPEGVSLQPIGG